MLLFFFILQANFYLSDFSDKGEHQPLPCNLCDGVQDAKFRCCKCQNCFCNECRRYHDKCCQAIQVTELQSYKDPVSISPRVVRSTAGSQHKQQVQCQLHIVEDVLKKLMEQEKKVNQERRAIEHDIHVFYATLLQHAGEARDTSLVSLRDVSEGMTEQLQSHMTQTRQIREILLQQLSFSHPASMAMSVSQLSTMLCDIGDLQAKLKNYSSSVLKYNRRDDPELLAECLRLFMGTVVESAQAPDPSTTSTRDSTAKQSLEIPQETPKSPPVTLSNGQHVLSDVKQQLDYLTEKLSVLQSGNVQLSQSIDETKNKLSTGHSSIQQEMSCLRDKYGILQQDVAVLIAENDKLRQEQAHIKGVNDDTIAVRKDLKKTEDNVTFLQQTVKSVQDSLQDSVTKVTELETKMGMWT